MAGREDRISGRKPVLIIGGGISGISAAVEAAETGLRVILVEKKPYLGGWVSRMNEYFPKLCPPYCGLEINFRRMRKSERIEILTSSELTGLSGTPGDFRARIRREPEYVSASCTVCGDCAAACPEETADAFNLGLSRRKAIDLPHELCFPPRFHLDPASCRMNECGECVKVCRYNAINLDAEPQEIEVSAGSVLFCTGWEAYDPLNIPSYRFSESQDIITNVMMERLGAPNGPTGGQIQRLSDGQPARRVAFIQCAGSRDENHLPYCSAVCCSASLKQAIYFADQGPENRADIFYIDLRVSGRNEDFLNRVQNHDRIRLIRGKAPGVDIEGGELSVGAEDILSGRKIRDRYDLVVLATGIVPRSPSLPWLEKDKDGFIARPALDDGMSAGGCCSGPADVASTIRESTGLIIKALQNG